MNRLQIASNIMDSSGNREKCSLHISTQSAFQNTAKFSRNAAMNTCGRCAISNEYSYSNGDHNFIHLPCKRSSYAQRVPNRLQSKTAICATVVFILLSSLSECVMAKVVQTSTCKAWVDGRVINLEPLQRLDGTPRFNVSYGAVSFTFNPCASFNMPRDPHSGTGDHCYYVSVCKMENSTEATPAYFTLGIQSSVQVVSKSVRSRLIPPEVRALLDVSEESSEYGEGGDDSDSDSGEIHGFKPMDAIALFPLRSHKSGKTATVFQKSYGAFYGEGESFVPGGEVYDSDESDETDPGFEELDRGHYHREKELNSEDSHQNIMEYETLGREYKNNSNIASDDVIVSSGDMNVELDQNLAEFNEYDDSSFSSSEEMRVIYIAYKGVRSMKKSKTFIYLLCDHKRRAVEEAVFRYLPVRNSKDYHFELHHQCACPDGCPDFGHHDYRDYNNHARAKNESEMSAETASKPDPKFMWLILVINGGIVVFAIIIGGVFCRQGGGNGAYYNMLPALHSSRLTMASTDSLFVSRSKLHKPEYLEYTSALTKASQPPVIHGGLILHRELDIGQRLGGGLFGDTYLAELHERKVAAKRINVGVHQNQLNQTDLAWILKEVNKLSRLNSKHLMPVLGLCQDSPQPYVILEHVTGCSLKDALRHQLDNLPWTRRLKMSVQIAEAMAYLHAASPPVLHRDLRCSNIMLDENDRIKVCDFGLTHIIQRLRQKCNGRRGCYCRREMSAVPSSVRWTAPEVLFFPTADEGHHSETITSCCDVYSMAMVMWELATSYDPFEDIPDEEEVIEIVKGGGRPPLDSVTDIHPLYAELTKKCWSQKPDNRPTFKSICGQLKKILQSLTKAGTAASKRQRTTSTTSYMQSLLTHAAE